jgi:hypothetical protein
MKRASLIIIGAVLLLGGVVTATADAALTPALAAIAPVFARPSAAAG